MKEQRSVWLAGVETFAMACVMDGSIWYPADEKWKPVKLTVGCTNFHLDVLRVIFASLEELSDMLGVLQNVVIYDYVINNAPEYALSIRGL